MKILNESDIDVKVIEYIKEGLLEEDLIKICNFLKVKPIDIVRTSDKNYKSLSISDRQIENDEYILKLILENPAILQRPIFVNGENAVIGRPPEKILDIL